MVLALLVILDPPLQLQAPFSIFYSFFHEIGIALTEHCPDLRAIWIFLLQMCGFDWFCTVEITPQEEKLMIKPENINYI